MSPKFAIASLSLGNCAHHNLPTKIRTAASLGYDGIEIFIPDFEAFVDEVRGPGLHCDLFPDGRPSTEDCLEVECAKAIARLCDSVNIAIPVLQPLRGFENFASPTALGGGGLAAALQEAERWLKLMPHLNTSLLSIPPPSQFLQFRRTPEQGQSHRDQRRPHSFLHQRRTSSRCIWIRRWRHLRLLARSQSGMVSELATSLWRGGRWSIIGRRSGTSSAELTARTSGSFSIPLLRRANQYADPTVSSTFLRNSASCSRTPISIPASQKHELVTTHLHPQNATHSALLQNLALLALTIPGDKIFLYQVADAGPPCSSSSTIEPTPCAPARMTWSRAARLFPCEEERGGWLPVTDMSLAVAEAGYPALGNDAREDVNAWWSLEVFNNSLMEPRPECVAEHGVRGLVGVRTLWERVCARIEAVKDDREVQSPTHTDDSQSSDGGTVLSDSETSEEIRDKAVGDDCKAGRRKFSTQWMDGCIVG